MCLYPKLIENRKYKPNKKNGGQPPPIKDIRTNFVPIGCGKCMECRKQKSMKWSIRLQEEIRTDKTGEFVTLSFSDEQLNELDKEVQRLNRDIHNKLNSETGKRTKFIEITGYELENEIAKLAVRRFLERWRKIHKTSIKHWLVTELGHVATERIHIHGLIFGNPNEIRKLWKYGNIWIGDYVNESTINYIVKYIYKTDKDHKYYSPVILTSAGIGSNYINRLDSKTNKFKGEDTKDTYTTRQGVKIALPEYYKYKIYSEQEKEQLWLQTLNKEVRYINGLKIDISNGDEEYQTILKEAQKLNTILGYGDDKINYNEKAYEQQRRNIQRYTRKQKEFNKGKGID
ncbi:MAG: replication initiator protein [Microviridae sp.]|nr:MAG: replication initiator protein [Microviridae sp.]